MSDDPHHSGSCLCGAVRYEVAGAMRPVVACHCSLCRKQSGHHVAATQVRRADLSITGAENLSWYRATDNARRGFCKTCGSQMFWEPDGRNSVAIFAGSLDAPTGLKIAAHIFVADKGDYYEIADGVPQYPTGDTKPQTDR